MTVYTTVERSAMIPAPPEVVVALITDFREWVRWSPWEGLDANLHREYSGAESGVGAVYQWSGNRKAGAGRMETTRVAPASVDIDLQFTKPFKSASKVTFAWSATPAGTQLVWRMRTPRAGAMRVLGLVVSQDRLIGPDLAKGLARLAEVAAE